MYLVQLHLSRFSVVLTERLKSYKTKTAHCKNNNKINVSDKSAIICGAFVAADYILKRNWGGVSVKKTKARSCILKTQSSTNMILKQYFRHCTCLCI